MSTLANSDDPDEMPHMAFHLGLNCLLRQNDLQRKTYTHFYLEIITCDPSIYTMDHPKFIVSNQKEEFMSTYRVFNTDSSFG